MKTKSKRTTSSVKGVSSKKTGDLNKPEVGSELTYFRVELQLRFTGAGFMCKSESQEALNDVFGNLVGIATPKSWNIGFDADRPFAETILASTAVYAVIPKTEADGLSDEQVGKQIKKAVMQWLLSDEQLSHKRDDGVKELIEGFNGIGVNKIERATKPQEDWFGCPGLYDEDEEVGAV